MDFLQTSADFGFHVSVSGHGSTCGGSILSAYFILTAAHCVSKYLPAQNLTVTAGAWKKSLAKLSRVPDPYEPQVLSARIISIHENYSRETGDNDLALIALDTPLYFSSQVRTIALPRHSDRFSGNAKVAGWDRDLTGRRPSKVFRTAVVPLVPRERCQEIYNLAIGQNVTERMLCTGGVGRGVCRMETGGPVVCSSGGRREVLCGVVISPEGCGRSAYPGLNVNVSSYLDWIAKTRKQMMAESSRLSKRTTGGKCEPSRFYCKKDGKCHPSRDYSGLFYWCNYL